MCKMLEVDFHSAKTMYNLRISLFQCMRKGLPAWRYSYCDLKGRQLDKVKRAGRTFQSLL